MKEYELITYNGEPIFYKFNELYFNFANNQDVKQSLVEYEEMFKFLCNKVMWLEKLNEEVK